MTISEFIEKYGGFFSVLTDDNQKNIKAILKNDYEYFFNDMDLTIKIHYSSRVLNNNISDLDCLNNYVRIFNAKYKSVFNHLYNLLNLENYKKIKTIEENIDNNIDAFNSSDLVNNANTNRNYTETNYNDLTLKEQIEITNNELKNNLLDTYISNLINQITLKIYENEKY